MGFKKLSKTIKNPRLIKKMIKLPMRYVPKSLTKKEMKKQLRMILNSRKKYKKGQYTLRDKINSYLHKDSKHVRFAKRMYDVEKIVPGKELAEKTGCSIQGLKQIVRKGEGAYYSSGSRPNQTAQSWGLARLASSITGGKSSKIDYSILEKECDHNKKAFRLAKKNLIIKAHHYKFNIGKLYNEK